MRTDSMDRFGTQIERRFTKNEIIKLLKKNGFNKIKFSNHAPYWICVCYKK